MKMEWNDLMKWVGIAVFGLIVFYVFRQIFQRYGHRLTWGGRSF